MHAFLCMQTGTERKCSYEAQQSRQAISRIMQRSSCGGIYAGAQGWYDMGLHESSMLRYSFFEGHSLHGPLAHQLNSALTHACTTPLKAQRGEIFNQWHT